MIAPYIALALKKVAQTATRKTRFLNRPGLMIGSAAWTSTRRNAAHVSAAKASRPMIWAEAHGCSVPAQERDSNVGMAATTSSAAPR